MGVRTIAWAMVRRWYIVVAVFLLTAAGGYALYTSGGLYTTETIIALMLPDKTRLSPNSGLDDASVIAFAGIVAQEVNNGRPPARYSTDAAPLYGAGVREGVLVTIPNSGNQWVTSYLRAEIQLSVVGPTEEWVAETQAALVEKTTQVADALQTSVAPDSRITASVVPLTSRIFHIVPSRTEQIGALAALALAATIVAGWASVFLDSRVRGRARASMRGGPVRVGEAHA